MYLWLHKEHPTLHCIKKMYRWEKKFFMLLKMFNKEKNGSFEIYSLESNLKCFIYGIAVKHPFRTFIL